MMCLLGVRSLFWVDAQSSKGREAQAVLGEVMGLSCLIYKQLSLIN